jgi:hypothetical protein
VRNDVLTADMTVVNVKNVEVLEYCFAFVTIADLGKEAQIWHAQGNLPNFGLNSEHIGSTSSYSANSRMTALGTCPIPS